MLTAWTRKASTAGFGLLCCAMIAVFCGFTFGPVGMARAAGTIGIVPPANPKHNCDTSADTDEQWTVASIDRCRAKEGVGPMVLPRNWGSLTVAQKLLVLIDLERVNRGLAPIVGLTPAITKYAKQGADDDADPGFPASGHFSGGSIWAGTRTIFEADYGWMYDDGYGAVRINIDCTSAHSKGCWGHRDNVLMDRSPSGGKLPAIVGGGAYRHGSAYNSYAFEMLAGYSHTGMTFTWASELAHFATGPAIEPLKKPAIKSVTPARGPAAGGSQVTVKGSALKTLSAIDFGSAKGALLKCPSNQRCTVVAPRHSAGKVKLTAVNAAGRSAASSAASFTYTS